MLLLLLLQKLRAGGRLFLLLICILLPDLLLLLLVLFFFLISCGCCLCKGRLPCRRLFCRRLRPALLLVPHPILSPLHDRTQQLAAALKPSLQVC